MVRTGIEASASRCTLWVMCRAQDVTNRGAHPAVARQSPSLRCHLKITVPPPWVGPDILNVSCSKRARTRLQRGVQRCAPWFSKRAKRSTARWQGQGKQYVCGAAFPSCATTVPPHRTHTTSTVSLQEVSARRVFTPGGVACKTSACHAAATHDRPKPRKTCSRYNGCSTLLVCNSWKCTVLPTTTYN